MNDGKNTREREGEGNGPPSTRPLAGSLARVPRANSRDGSTELNTSAHSATPSTGGAPPRLMHAPRSHVRRSQSFKRTASGSSKTPSNILDSLDPDVDLVGDTPPVASGTVTNTNSGTATPIEGGSGHSAARSAASSPMVGRVTTTRNFVKNFLEEDPDDDAPSLAGARHTTSSNTGLQFDAETQRNVHRSLLSTTPDSPARIVSGSQSNRWVQASPQPNLFQKRDDFYNVDQSVNLVSPTEYNTVLYNVMHGFLSNIPDPFVVSFFLHYLIVSLFHYCFT
jgi:hypothetical protein